MTMNAGLVDQAEKFKKRVASIDIAPYKVVLRNQLVVGFPIDEGVLSFQDLYDEAISARLTTFGTFGMKERSELNTLSVSCAHPAL
jgi:hypothetical protein